MSRKLQILPNLKVEETHLKAIQGLQKWVFSKQPVGYMNRLFNQTPEDKSWKRSRDFVIRLFNNQYQRVNLLKANRFKLEDA